ncbi:2-oxoglutarate dehydrogenase, E2 component, dihydrolipoamide succinyltransferase, partial [Micromonospora chalcea]|uniref:2-oxoglutarate dehydrogenase, E2 component, dihydrolipoamide succinyltransferase n=1 Tax=Micromonospora chalcea TaxID=1874 RepID=UPI0021A7FF2A
MPVSVTMPRLGESVTEGTVTRWLKQEGDTVEVDEPLLEVSTDKVDTEIPSPAAGVLSRIVVGEDETAEVGSELAVIADEGEDAGAAPAEKAEPATEPTAAAEGTGPEPERAEEAAAEPGAEAEQSAVEAPAESAAPSGEGTPVTMPALGESVTEGTVTRWLKQVGETVEVDEPLLEVSTDKVDTEIPSPVAGTLQEIKVAEDETADVGAVLAIVGVAGAAPAKAEPKPEPKPEPKAEAKPEPKPEPKVEEPTPGASYNEPAAEAEQAAQPAKAEQAAQPAAPAAAPRRSVPAEHGEDAAGYVTPLVRKLAAEHGVDLGSVKGTGVGGRIRKQDVLEAAEKAKAAKPAPAAAAPAAKAEAPAQPAAKPQPSAKRGTTEKLPRIRSIIAKRLQQSLHETAQLTTVVEVDVTKVAKLRARAKDSFQAKHGVKLSFLPFFAVAAIEALQTYPIIQASMDLDGGTITYPGAEHLGIAVDTERGLLTPVIHNAGDLNMGGLAKRIADLAERTRANKITPDEMAGATFTLTNTGSRGALFDTPIVPSPQSAMLGTGAVVKRPVVVNDAELGEVVAIRSMVYLALSYDHRLIDGADAARFLTAVKERLEGGN